MENNKMNLDENHEMEKETDISKTENRILPAVALRGLTVLPDMIIHFDLSRKVSISAIEKAMLGNQKVFLVTQKDPNIESPSQEDVYEIGTIALIKQITKMPGNIVRVLVDGLESARLLSFDDENTEYLSACLEEIQDNSEEIDKTEKEAMLRTLRELFETYSNLYPNVGKSLAKYFKDGITLKQLLNQIAINMPLVYTSKQKILETTDVREQFELITAMLFNESEIAKIKNEISKNIKERVDKHQKEYLLREQLAYIRQELGEDEESEIKEYEAKLEKLKANKDVKDKIKKEIKRLKGMAGSNSEAAMERTYLDTLFEMPWNKSTKENLDIEAAGKILREGHYGLDKVKERIIEILAVRCLTNKGETPILCLVGPPGTGKTSIAHSIAEALNRKYVRICLGGVRDEAEIRGHRRTYIGAMPGRIATGMLQAGVKNPLMLLDEIDKVSSDYKGDTSSALLEVLDSEQNNKFRDHYIEIPIDLSEVLFIATANSLSTVPKPLLDRMEIIEISGYTANEKFHIAKDYLLKKQFEKNGMNGDMLNISAHALKDIIAYYTREAGIRSLERSIGTLCRKAAKELLEEKKKAVKVTSGNLEKYLGKRKYSIDKANEKDDIGIVRGLAWTSVGGDTLQIEVNTMPGKGELKLTGQLGDVMKESAMIALSFVRSISKEYKVKEEFFEKHDIHIHVPEGAVPKDGPSAGVTMSTAILSAVAEIPVSCKVAMTGEVTLRGRVLPIGGLKEKLLAAKMAGMEKVLVPYENRKDIDEIPKEITDGLEIVPVKQMKEVYEQALVFPK